MDLYVLIILALPPQQNNLVLFWLQALLETDTILFDSISRGSTKLVTG